MSNADDGALQKLKKKLKEQSQEPLYAWVEEVELAQSHMKGKKNPDWDPLDHPKDSEGKFTEKHSATFVGKGKAKSGYFTDTVGKKHLLTLKPGEKLHKVPSGVHVVEHADGSLSYAVPSQHTPTQAIAKVIKDDTPTLVTENPAAPAPKVPETVVHYTIGGEAHKASLDPGDKLLSVPIGTGDKMYVVQKPNGDLFIAPGESNSGLKIGVGSILSDGVAAGNFKVVAEADAPKVQAPEISYDDLDHPALMKSTTGVVSFVHPVSGLEVELKPGQTFYQHKTSPNSFILVNEGEQDGTFFNKHGQALKSNPSTKVWTLKNYNQIWPPSKTTAAAAEKAKKKLSADEKAAIAKQKLAELGLQPKPVQEFPTGSPQEDPLAEWEKELLESVAKEKAEKQQLEADSFLMPGGKTYTLGKGEKLYKKQSNDSLFVLVSPSGMPFVWVSSLGGWDELSSNWWATAGVKKYDQIGGPVDAPEPWLAVSHEPEDGPWGAIPQPDGSGKVQLHPGDSVFYRLNSSGDKEVVVLNATQSQAVGKFYSATGSHPYVNSLQFYQSNKESWAQLVQVPIADVTLKKGKDLGAGLNDLAGILVQSTAALTDKLGGLKSTYGSWSSLSEDAWLPAYTDQGALTLVTNTVATIEATAPNPSLAAQKYLAAFRIQQELMEWAQLVASSSDVEEVESRWAHLWPKLSTIDPPSSFPWPANTEIQAKKKMEGWRFEQATSSKLGFDLNNSSASEKHQYMVSQGFTSAGALSDEQAKQWIMATLGSPSVTKPASVKKSLEAFATYKAIGAQAEMALKKTLKPEKPKPATEADKAVAAQDAHFQESIKKLALSYENGDSTIAYSKPDEWAVWEGSQFVNTMTTHAVMQKLKEQPGWSAASIGTVGGAVLFDNKLKDWEDLHDTTLEAASKTVLNTYIKQNGGNYVALMKASHKQDWIRFHLAGDEVAKWQLEWALADKTYHLHKWEDSHPGSWGTPEGIIARQATADFLASQEWFADLKDQLGKTEPDWSEVFNLPSTAIADAFVSLGLETQYGKTGGAAKKRNAVAWWLESRGRLPESQVQTPAVLAEPEKPKKEDFELDASVAPAGVDPTAWNLVLAAEAGVPEVSKLATPSGIPFEPLPLGLNPNLVVPELVQHLAMWTYPLSGENTMAELVKSKKLVKQAIQARAAQGAWAPPSYLTWEDPSGGKHPLAPGSEVYKIGSDAYVLGEGSNQNFTINSSGGVSSLYATEPEVKADGTLVLTAPKPLTYSDYYSAGENLGFGKSAWTAIEEVEALPAGTAKFPGYSLDAQTPNVLLGYLKNHPDTPPYIKANVDKLPDNIKLMTAWAQAEKDTSVVNAVEWKLKKGHYAQAQLGVLLDPEASYFPFVMKGLTSSDDMWMQWPNSAAVELGKVLGIKPSDSSGWVKKDMEALHEGLVKAFKVELPTLPSKTKSNKSALPDTLTLTPIAKSLGGMHTKQAWVDQAGNEWMSKAFKNDPNSGARIDAEHVAMTIGRLFGAHSPETRTMNLQGQYQYVQHLAPAKGDLSGRTPESLTVDQLGQVMEEHVIDWLNSNHDSHPMNFLLDPDGKNIIPIDKGQAWRFFGQDELAVGYLPPSNPIAVWYDQFYYAVQNGQVDKDRLDKVTKRVLSKAYQVQTKYDAEVRDLLKQAFDKRVEFPSGYGSKKALLEGVMARKASMLSDFEAFYQKLYKSGGIPWDIDVEQLKKTQLDPHTHTTLSDKFAADVTKAGVHGKSLMFDTTDLEDAHMVVYTEKSGAKVELAGQAMVRAEGDTKVTAWLKAQLVEHETDQSMSSSVYSTDGPSTSYASLPNNDTWYSDLVSAAKTVNHHAVDKEYNQTTLQTLKTSQSYMKEVLKELQAWEQKNPEKAFKSSQFSYSVVTAEQQAAWKSMLIRYISDADRIFAAKDDGTKVAPHVAKVDYFPSEGLNTSGEPKPTVLLTKGGDTLTVWDDLNYVLESAGSKVKLDGNGYKSLIESGGWKVKAPGASALAAGGTESWTLKGKGGKTLATWTKAPGDESWKSGSELMSDSELQQKIAEKPGLWSFEGPDVDQQSEVKVGAKVFKVYKRQSYGTEGTFDYQSGELSVHGKLSPGYGQTGYQYDVEYGDVLIQYRPWDEPGVAPSQQGLLRFKVKNWQGTTEQMEDVLDTLRTMGLDLSDADEESLQLFYWRHLMGILQDRADGHSAKWGKITQSFKDAQSENPNMSASEELAALQAAWATVIGEKAVETADWMPKFSRFNPHVTHDDAEFTAGHPYWLRPDADIEDVRASWGENSLAISSVGNFHNMDQIVLSGGMLSTEERTRVLGQWVTGMSSSEDQGYGSGGFVFTRQNLSSSYGQVYYHPKVALRTSNYSFNGDNFGDIKKRKSSAYWGLKQALSHSDSGNELMVKHGMSFLDDIAVVRFPNEEARDKVLNRYKELGITELHGVPIEKVLVTSDYEAEKSVKLIWAAALKEAKA